jgi:Tol biopolymer transport system component
VNVGELYSIPQYSRSPSNAFCIRRSQLGQTPVSAARLRMAFLAVVVVTGAAACSKSSPSAAKPPAPSTSAPTASSGPSSATPSAAVINGTIVFRRFADQTHTKSQIVVARLDGTHEQVLTDPGPQGADTYPVWSPDGKTIAFGRSIPETTCVIKTSCNFVEVFTVSPTGGPATQLTHSPPGVLCAIANIFSCNASPDFSPDGKHIVYERTYATASGGGSHNNLWIANADGTDAHQVTNPKYPLQDQNAAWSPDGKSIAFWRSSTAPGDNSSSIYTVRIDGSGLRQLTPGDLRLTEPIWSPDGSKIIAAPDSDPNSFSAGSLYSVRPDGTGLTNLTGTSADLEYTFGAYSPDGRYIITSRVQSGVNNNNAELWLLTATGTPIRQVLPNSHWQSQARWDPASP